MQLAKRAIQEHFRSDARSGFSQLGNWDKPTFSVYMKKIPAQKSEFYPGRFGPFFPQFKLQKEQF